jgi:ABC-2 type transport system ATP-binding protein
MLGLIRRIGTEFGMSVVVASHLLGEIEAICDSLIVIDGGHLLRHDTLASFTEAEQLIAVQVDEGAEELLARLRRDGLIVDVDGADLVVHIAGDQDGALDSVRDAIADLGLPLHRLQQRRHRVEELFQDNAEEVSHVG